MSVSHASLNPLRVAILGGAFDPVHCDHLQMASAALAHGHCDEVWFLPSPDRWDKRPHATAEHRLAMLRLACKDTSLPISVRDSEIHAGQYRGTLHMLRRLHRDHPGIRFLLLVGADSLVRIPDWRDPLEYDGTNPNGLELLREFPLIVYPRDGYPQPDPLDFRGKGWMEPCLFSDVAPGRLASSQLRSKLWRDSQSHVQLPAGVWEYIRNHRLYRPE